MPASWMCRGSQAWAAWTPRFTGTGNLDSGQAVTWRSDTLTAALVSHDGGPGMARLAPEAIRPTRCGGDSLNQPMGCANPRPRGEGSIPVGENDSGDPPVHARVLSAKTFLGRDEVGGRGSGGANALSVAAHQARGTYRADRHAHLVQATAVAPVSPPDRKRTLAGLPTAARRLAVSLMESHGPWTAASLETLRAYVLSCARLEGLQQDAGEDTRALHREVRTNLQLLKTLELKG
jgi:hypothetical protein